MFSGWRRAFVLFAAATLVAYAQCYGACALACGSVQPPSGGCHHKSSHHHDAGCANPHAEFTAPEVGVAKVHAATSFPTFAVLTDVIIPAPERLHLPHAAIGSPPGGSILSNSSVL